MRSLGMSARETAARLGISPRTLGRLLSVDDSRPRSAPALDPALGTYPAAKFAQKVQHNRSRSRS